MALEMSRPWQGLPRGCKLEHHFCLRSCIRRYAWRGRYRYCRCNIPVIMMNLDQKGHGANRRTPSLSEGHRNERPPVK
eukprot:1161944-Pelagomonas_calceolata.AAC.2